MSKPYDRPHLFVQRPPAAEPFKSVQAGGGGKPKLRSHDRAQHGKKLLQELAAAVGAQPLTDTPVRVEFQSEPGFDLTLKSLDSPSRGLELLAVREQDGVTYASVLINRDGLARLQKLVAQYVKETTPQGQPKNQVLIDSIARIRRAVLESLWTEIEAPLPEPQTGTWFEVWLRLGDPRLLEDNQLPEFRQRAEAHGLTVSSRQLVFVDRVVVLVGGLTENLAALVTEDMSIAEVRLAKLTGADFMELSTQDQTEWARDLEGRMTAAPIDAPAVCVLDTGVNRGHLLLQSSITPSDVQTCNDAWGKQDHEGHGTMMAGLALHGDLTPLLSGKGPLWLTHRVESVKILPPVGNNPPEVWGAITTEGIARAEVQAPTRGRVSCLAVTSDARDRGEPSSWSGALDHFTSGADDGQRRLICVSAGNLDIDSFANYPSSNETESIQDPAQAWNVLTVGGVANRDVIAEPSHQSWSVVAPLGDLCPSSTTSLTWSADWTIKPDIVMPGGNAVLDPGGIQADALDSLSLLSTYHKPLVRHFMPTGDTSAAAALASRLGATILAQYPKLWPETVRALMVQSAEWTAAMNHRCPGKKRSDIEQKLRRYGFGVPNAQVALASAANDATIIIEQEIQPFDERVSKSDYVTRDMHLHALPWPIEVLQGLGETEIELRVTLSYFIEPSPGRKGWKNRHRYPSFGLRFDMKTSTESEPAFRKRINSAARAEDEGATSKSDSKHWLVGPQLRAHGSLHSDRWVGPAVELADKGMIAVYPSLGWWRERPQLGRWDKKTRYALIISLRAPGIDTDIYTPIATQVDVPVQIAVPTTRS